MTLTYKDDLDIMKMYPYTKNELSRLTFSNVRAQTDRQSHRQTDVTECITALHFLVVTHVNT